MPKGKRNPELMQLKNAGVIPLGSTLLKYDGRKNLSPGQKSAVSRLYNVYAAMAPGLDFVHVRRKPRESNAKYKARVERIKKNSGQHHPFNAVGVESKFMDHHENKVSFENDRLNITSQDYTGAVYYTSHAIDYARYIKEGFKYLDEFTIELEEHEYISLKPLNALGYTTYLSGNLFPEGDERGRKDIVRMLKQIVSIANAYRQDINLDTSGGVKAFNSYNNWFTGFQLKRIEDELE